MTDRRIPCAVLGASGYIGQHFVRLLDEHPTFDLRLMGAGERSEGRTLAEVWQLADMPPVSREADRLVQLTPARVAAAGVRVAFSALPTGTAGPVERELTRRGVAVFSNAADHRMDPDAPLLVPEVNADHLALLTHRPRGRAPLVTNPNCSTTGLVLALAPIVHHLRPKAVHVATYQSLSGAGYPGVPSLAITDNVVPYIRDEEEKLTRETGRLLGRLSGGQVESTRFPVLAHCARVGTREGHLEAVTVEASARPTLERLIADWVEFRPLDGRALPTAPDQPVLVRTEADRPQPLRDRWAGTPARARGMAAVVGRVRWEPPYLRFCVLSHNAVRGGAGGSLLNAELAADDGWLRPGRGGP